MLHKSDAAFKMVTAFVKFFSNGWGNPEIIQQLSEWQKIVLDKRKMLEDVYKVLEKTEIKITAAKKINSSLTVYKGEFMSPLTKFIPKALPPESEKAYFELVLPNKWKNKKPICLHLAGTGDHFFWRRRHFMATPLAKQYSMGSIILENPFYGCRKPKDQVRSAVNHVSDIFVMGAALLFETVTLMLWCQRNGYGPLGITGISMGGHMATVSASGWFEPMAIVPCLSWSSAGPAFTDGVLSQSVNWQVLDEQLEREPIYSKLLRQDEEFKRLLKTHYVCPNSSEGLNQPIQQSNDTTKNESDDSKASFLYSKFSSILPNLQISSYIDFRGKKIGPIALEVDLWKYLETIPKSLYNSTNNRLNLDYIREFALSSNFVSTSPSKETVAYMTAIMDQATHLSHFNKPHKDSPITYVVAEHDRYIPREFYNVTPQDIYPQAEVRTINTGHVMAVLKYQQDFRDAIRDCYEKLGCDFS